MSHEIFDRWVQAIRNDEPVCLVTVIEAHGEVADRVGEKLLVQPAKPSLGTLGHPELDRVVERDALAELEVGRSGVRSYGTQGQQRETDLTVFIESQAPPPRMLIFGAVDFTAALADLAKLLGYRVVVADARPVFATRKRFPMADELRVSWPDQVFDEFGADLGPRDAVAILTHDNKFDVPAVVRALATNVGYIGVMGSRKTHERRTERLRDAGVDDEGLARLRSPLGIDIGGRTPEETAVSICAEIIALRSGRKVTALRDTDGPIHER